MIRNSDKIKFNNKSDIKFEEIENGRVGANSIIYRYNEDEVMKIFHYSAFDREERILKYFLKKYNGQCVLKPNKLIYIDNKLYGYTLNYSNGVMLHKINDDVLLNDFINSFKIIEKDIIEISNNQIFMDDLSSGNMLYDDNKKITNIIDYDYYKYMDINKTNMLRRNKNELLQAILFSFIKNYKSNRVGEYTQNKVFEEYSIVDVLYEIKDYIENIKEKEITTIKDIRDNSDLILELKPDYKKIN